MSRNAREKLQLYFLAIAIWLMSSSHYMILALIFKSLIGIVSSLTRAPDQRQTGGDLLLASRHWRGVCELLIDVRKEPH